MGKQQEIMEFIMGLLKGKKHVILDGAEYQFTDPNNDGHVVITEVSNGNETTN